MYMSFPNIPISVSATVEGHHKLKLISSRQLKLDQGQEDTHTTLCPTFSLDKKLKMRDQMTQRSR